MFNFDEDLYNKAVDKINSGNESLKSLVSKSSTLMNFPPEFPYTSNVTDIVDDISLLYIDYVKTQVFVNNALKRTKGLSSESNNHKHKPIFKKIKKAISNAGAFIKEKVTSLLGKNKFLQALLSQTGAKISKKIRSKLENIMGLKSEMIAEPIQHHGRDDLLNETKYNKTDDVILPSIYALPHHARKATMENGKEFCDKRIAMLGGYQATDAKQREFMTTIDVPVWTGTEKSTIPITVNKKLVNNYKNAFEKVADMKFPIQHAEAYAWDHFKPGGSRSEHCLGGTIDINSEHNFGSGDSSEFAVRQNEEVIRAFEEQGFFWGGEWEGSTTDDMHFSFTGG